eukprot:TRINITY_DN42753_c0_g1_i1.p2 TRINITY_DN42753_c0_g1~~TRINITY_DN42753_c0_g1_i1.p2  ORF type:complete len:105 (+),score=2.17 TRINITY_DN42753_c0_g1_i1:331-645(+)
MIRFAPLQLQRVNRALGFAAWRSQKSLPPGEAKKAAVADKWLKLSSFAQTPRKPCLTNYAGFLTANNLNLTQAYCHSKEFVDFRCAPILNAISLRRLYTVTLVH